MKPYVPPTVRVFSVRHRLLQTSGERPIHFDTTIPSSEYEQEPYEI